MPFIPPSRHLHHHRHRHHPASFSTVSVSLSLHHNSSSSSISAISVSLDHKPSLQMPFLLDKRLRSDNHNHNHDVVNKHTVSAVAAAGGGFKAIPARPNFGQVWSFAAAASSDMVVLQHNKLHFLRQFFSSSPWGRPGGVGDSAARVGNYPPIAQGHLNLLASLTGAPLQSSGRREDDSR